jgi:serine/threonine-protein kinase
MMIAEAQIASRMAHPNICQVYELGETDGQLYIAMEHLEGVSLLALFRACAKEHVQLPIGFVAGMLAQLCDGLHYAHELKNREGEDLRVIHRDVSPSNVFVCETGLAKLLDFGIAKMKDSQATQTETVKGKHAYMAPEQLRGGTLTRQVDVFALGVVAFEMLALRRLFHRKTEYLTFRAVIELPIADVRRYRPELPASAATVLATALERDPARRYATARQLGEALRDTLPGPAWSRDEIGELLRSKFKSELEMRQAAIATAIEQTTSGVIDRSLLATPPPPTSEAEEDDDSFPSVDTGDAGPVVEPAAAPPAPAAAPGPRGRGPLVAGVLVVAALAAGAILVVPRLFAKAGVPAPADAPWHVETPEDPTPYLRAVAPKQPQLQTCAKKHPTKLEAVVATMKIDKDGALTSLTFEPEQIAPAALGACLREILQTVTFPPKPGGGIFSLRITFGAKPPR